MQKRPKMLVWVHDLDLYKHLTNFGGRRPTEGGGQSPAGEFFPPCPWGQPRSGGGERGEASATKQKKPALKAGLFSSGGRTRTYDLRVMSPTSYRLLYSAMWSAKVGSFFEIPKFF